MGSGMDEANGSRDRMVLCHGCGLNVERQDVISWPGPHPTLGFLTSCTRCTRCTPDVREAHRRGFNAGLAAMAQAVRERTEQGDLHRPRDQSEDDRIVPANELCICGMPRLTHSPYGAGCERFEARK